MEPFPVATAEEIVILRIGGADVRTVVVGNMPVEGPLVMAEPGEVILIRNVSDVRMEEGGPPIFWVRPMPDDQ